MLAEANINPDWAAGVSIGAINAAIIAGNETSERVAKLRTFWQEITTNPLLDWAAAAHTFAPKGNLPRALFNQLSASCAVTTGAAGFFTKAVDTQRLIDHLIAVHAAIIPELPGQPDEH